MTKIVVILISIIILIILPLLPQWLWWVGGGHQLVCGTAGAGEVWLWQVDDYTTDTLPGYGHPAIAGAITEDG